MESWGSVTMQPVNLDMNYNTERIKDATTLKLTALKTQGYERLKSNSDSINHQEYLQKDPINRNDKTYKATHAVEKYKFTKQCKRSAMLVLCFPFCF